MNYRMFYVLKLINRVSVVFWETYLLLFLVLEFKSLKENFISFVNIIVKYKKCKNKHKYLYKIKKYLQAKAK